MIFYSKISKQAFTLVELIVVITVLAILWTIGFISILGYQIKARDSTRIADITNISKVVELAELRDGSYPVVSNAINVSFSWSVIWRQGSFGNESFRESRRISEVPTDPLTGNEYAYATTTSTREYQVGGILERWGLVQNTFTPQANAVTALPNFSVAKVRGNYNGSFLAYTETIDSQNKYIYILGVPSILSSEVTDVSIETIVANKSFLYNGKKAIPSTYSGALNTDGLWSFTPWTTNAVVYSWSTSTLSVQAGKIDMLKKLRTYYKWTSLENVNKISQIVAIDPVADPVNAVKTVNNFVQTQTAGLTNTNITPTPLESVYYGNSPDSFVTTWSAFITDIVAHQNSLGTMVLRLPLQPRLTYDFIVDWGDGTTSHITSYNQAEATHTYVSPWIFTVVIDGLSSWWDYNSYFSAYCGAVSSAYTSQMGMLPPIIKQWGTVPVVPVADITSCGGFIL